jgi:formylglycine-generating enzyme required for sulfatase activity/serine/threonine protein kinase
LSTSDPLAFIGQTIADKYRVEELVGRGGMSVVYRAVHIIWKKPVAIKFFNGLSGVPEDQREELLKAFVREGAILTELSAETANIVQARDIGTHTDPEGKWTPYMVLELLKGSSLASVLEQESADRKPPWTLEQMLPLLAQAAAALDVAHGMGVTHRDIKPGNLFVVGSNPRSGKVRLKVLDFGVAKLVTDNTQLQLRATLVKTGLATTSFTPQYAAPEQFSRSYGATGPWTDVFALALVAVEMLTGRASLDGNDLMRLAQLSCDPRRRPTPRQLGAEVSDEVEAVFVKALSVRPSARYARATEFWGALEEAAGVGRPIASPTRSGVTANVQSVARPPTTTSRSALTLIAPIRAKRATALMRVSLGAVAIVLAGLAIFRGLRAAHQANSDRERLPPSAASPNRTAPAGTIPTCPARMVEIPAGEYFMGSDGRADPDDEKPSHQVSLDSFFIDLYEVRARDYRECSDAGKCRRAPTEVVWPNISDGDRRLYSELCTISDATKQEHPINCVTWEMASSFCEANGKRLPTEAEWEYAARGPDGRLYPWGDDAPAPDRVNACGSECVAWGKARGVQFDSLYAADDGYATTAPVGSFPKGRSRFGLFDVAGNVWEWVADWQNGYAPEPTRNPSGPLHGVKRVIRGGAWNGGFASWVRPSFRYAQVPEAQSHGIGFRCARSTAK